VADEVLGEVGVAVVVAEGGAEPDLTELRAHCARSLSDYKAPDALVVADEIPLTPMMKVDPVRLAGLAERGAAERRERLAQNRGPGSQVVGSDPTRASDQKERA
jgi:acyl-CoA synthetase (AMP-forming)/AMP-acid ligase II